MPKNHVVVSHPDTPLLTIVESEIAGLRWAVGTTENGLEVSEILDRHDLLANPRRVTGSRSVADLESFLAELTRRPLTKGIGTMWGNAGRGGISAVYNEHNADTAGWRDDRIILSLSRDPDWQAWHSLSGNYFKQDAFGDHIEDLLHTVTNPDQAELLEIIDSIRSSTAGEFESTIERAHDNQRLSYTKENTVKAGRQGQLEVPRTIELSLRPWEGHPSFYPVDAYFRVRINDGALTLAVKLKPTRRILLDAWRDLVGAIVGATSIPVYAEP